MATTDSVSVFAEGTLKDQVCSPMSFVQRAIIAYVFQIRELVDYLSRGLSEDNRQKSFGPILELVNTEPPTISKENQVKVLSLLVPEVKGLGEGSEKGAYLRTSGMLNQTN
jgi:hypothetical protein